MKSRMLVTVEVEVVGDVDLAHARLKGQTQETFPMLNGALAGTSGRYHIRCLGVRSVRRGVAFPAKKGARR